MGASEACLIGRYAPDGICRCHSGADTLNYACALRPDDTGVSVDAIGNRAGHSRLIEPRKGARTGVVA